MLETLPSGARLGSKSELQALVDVSEGTFNTALRLLQARDLVRVKSGPGGGIFVAEQSPIARLGNAVLRLDSDSVDIPESIQVRWGLEYEIVRDACVYRNDRDVAELEATLREMEEAFASQDEDRFVRVNWSLHRRIASITPNRTLQSLYLGLLELIEGHTLRVVAAAGQNLHAFHEDRLLVHTDLIRVVTSGDEQAATGIVRAHNRGLQST